MKLSEALEISRRHLYQSGQRYPQRGHGYLCLAIVGAWKKEELSEAVARQLQKKVYRAIAGSTTLASYLDNNRTLPREVYESRETSSIQYNLFHPKYIEVRDKFVDQLMATLLEEEKLGISYCPA